MKQETSMSQGIRITEDNSEYDAACKRLLSERIILAWILKGCVPEYENYSVDEIAENYIEGTPEVATVAVMQDEKDKKDEKAPMVEGTNTEDNSVREGKVYFDIRFNANVPKSDGSITLIVNVEAQNDFNPGYPLIKRGIYYCARMISKQNGTVFTDSEYGKIRKVYSIWICTDVPKKWENTITQYHMTEKHKEGNVVEKVSNYDLLYVVIVGLGKPNSRKSIDTLGLLSVLLSNEVKEAEKREVLEKDYGIPMESKVGTEVSDMCNLSEGVFQKGHDEGRKEGRKEGLDEGIKSMVRVLRKRGISDSEIVSIIREEFNLTEDVAMEYVYEDVKMDDEYSQDIDLSGLVEGSAEYREAIFKLIFKYESAGCSTEEVIQKLSHEHKCKKSEMYLNLYNKPSRPR